MAKTIFEEMGGKYQRQGDYLIPCLTVPAEEEQPIGIWGQRHLDYLKHHCKVTYTNLLTSGRLNAYLADIDRQAQEGFERLIHLIEERLPQEESFCIGMEATGHYWLALYSFLHEQGYEHHHIELQLAHKERNEVSAAYNHALYLKERRVMMCEWANHLDKLRRGADVVPLRAGIA